MYDAHDLKLHSRVHIMKDLSPVMSENSNVILLLIGRCLFILQDQERRTPLHAAACVGDVHTMDLLIESGEWAVCISDTLMRMKNLDSCVGEMWRMLYPLQPPKQTPSHCQVTVQVYCSCDLQKTCDPLWLNCWFIYLIFFAFTRCHCKC